MSIMLWLSLGLCSPAHAVEPVVQRVSGGTIDWSALQLEVTVESKHARGAWQDRKLQEQDALDRLNAQITALARRVSVTPTLTAGALIDQGGELGDRLANGLRRWSVAEARYYNRGGVELVGTLDLRTWLWPALVELAEQESPLISGGDRTGMVIDARGMPLPLSLSPILLSASGEVLFDAKNFSQDAARRHAPVLYVSDPADPRAAERAGDAPLMVQAQAVEEASGALVLSPTASAALRKSLDLPAIASRGSIVVVVQP